MKNDLEKLAAEMQKMKPSTSSRKGGMDAAMAAFSAEFAPENVQATEAVKTASSENTSNTSQGLSGVARPTGQTIRKGRMDTFRSDMMSKIKSVFAFDLKTKMMMGSCAAALMFAAVIVPNSRPGFTEMPPQDTISEPVAVVEPLLVEPPKIDSAEPMAPVSSPTPKTTADKDADSNGTITSAGELLEKVRTKATQGAESIPQAAPSAPVREPIANLEGAVPEFEAPFDAKQSTSKTSPAPQIGRQQALAGQSTSSYSSSLPAAQLPPPPVIERLSAKNSRTSTPQIAAMPRTQKGYAPAQASAPQTKTLPGGLILEEVPAEYKTETKTIVTQEASTELVRIPATFETVSETVVVQPQSVEYITVPPKYEWVEGEIEGSTVEYETKPAEYETVTEQVVVQEASTELVTVPATFDAEGNIKTPARTQERVIPNVTKTETRRVVKSPASTIERVVPYEIKDGKTRVPVVPAKTVERSIPAVTKQVSRRVIKTPAATQERIVPAGTEMKVAVQTVIAPERFYLRDETGRIIREFASRDAFEKYSANPVISVEETPVSTFSIDVDTASYSFFRSSINRGQLPPPSSVRVEEMINYFPYDYDAPRSADEPFKANVTVTPTPWNADTKLMHIGIKGYVPPASERPDNNIVLLIDTSGSMNRPNKLPLLINSFKLLLNTLGEDDTVSIVTYAGSAGTVLEPTSASDKKKIIAALNNLRAGGSTAGAAGLELAFNKALESFDKDGMNRVILATDGDFNVGFRSPDEMKTFITEKRKTGIFLSVLGFGRGNYKDDLMQSLAQNGNGTAAYIDTLAEANKVLADESGSALITIAKDVKIQVEFNPDTIAEYRLIGYETRALKRQDFNNDTVDAGEIGAGHNVTAIYELTPVGSPARVIDDLRYVKEDAKAKSSGSDEIAFVKIRHKLPNSDTSTLQTFPVGPSLERNLKRASEDMRFAAAVAAVGQKLRGDTQLANYSYADAIELAVSGKGEDKHGYRSEFIQLLRLVDTMEK